jgi:cytochrome c biogenesis protein CcmG, thiol:disulfide interchange protein DsbE
VSVVTIESQSAREQESFVPTGLSPHLPIHPALKRWAKLFRPYGTRCLSHSPRHFHAGFSQVAALRLELRICLCATQQRIHYYSGVRRSQQLRSLLLFTGLTGLLLGLSACYGGSRPPRIGSNAPDFTVQDAQSKVTLSAYRGQVVVLNFWATWCPPCIEEMPSLVEMQRRMKAKGVTVLAVSVDVDEGAYKQFVKDHNVNLVTARDPDQKSNSLYGTSKFPETYIIDRNGVVRRKFIGAVDWTAPEITDFLGKL